MNKKVLYEQHEHKTIIDNQTGEVKSEETTHVTEVRVEREPDYVKLYLDHLGRFNNVPISFNPILREFLLNISYANSNNNGMILFLNKALKTIIAKKLNVSLARINQAVTEFVKKGYMKRLDRGEYQFNPFLFGKGEWKDIKAIRATYNYNTGEVKADIIKAKDSEVKDDKEEATNEQTYQQPESKSKIEIGKCPKCGKNIIKGKYGYFCSGKCGMNISKIYTKELTEEQIKKLLSGEKIYFSSNKANITVYPEIHEYEYNGKTHFGWKTSTEYKSY